MAIDPFTSRFFIFVILPIVIVRDIFMSDSHRQLVTIVSINEKFFKQAILA